MKVLQKMAKVFATAEAVENEHQCADAVKLHSVLMSFCLIAVTFLVYFGLRSLVERGYTRHCVLLLCAAGGVVANYIYLFVRRHGDRFRYIFIGMMGALCVYLLYSGGVDQTGPLWVYVFPLLTFFICGLRVGLFATFSLLAFMLGILYGPGILSAADYTGAFCSRLSATYFTVTVMAFALEYSRQRARNESWRALEKLEEKQRELNGWYDKMQDELLMAKDLQQSFFNHDVPAADSCEKGKVTDAGQPLLFSSRYIPEGKVGGDFYHIQRLSDHQAGVLICDVMGHEVRSAMVTAIILAFVETMRKIADQPACMMTRLNERLMSVLNRSNELMFTTAAYMVIDSAAMTVTYTLAGHHPPLLVSSHDRCIDELKSKGEKGRAALGIFDDIKYGEFTRTLNVGDILLLSTDGVFEAMDAEGREWGHDNFIQSLKRCLDMPIDGILEHIIHDIYAHAGCEVLDDDVCLVGVQVAGQ